MPATGIEKELDQLRSLARAQTRYVDLCLVLRRPVVRVRGAPGQRFELVTPFRWGDVVVRPCVAKTMPEGGELLLVVSSSPEAPGASSRIPAGATLEGPEGTTATFEPEELLRAGGRWDTLRRKWGDPDKVTAPLTVDMEESQVDFIRWFATWLFAFSKRILRTDTASIVYGGRRGGKTFACLLCLLATVIEVPELLGWAVSVSHVERDVDIDRNIKRLVPASWYQYREFPSHKYTFLNGSTLTNISAVDPEKAKRGQADFIFINEGGKMAAGVYENSLGGTADRGGLVLVASNPPMTTKGEWVEVEVTAADEAVAKGEHPDARIFRIRWELNRSIDQGARSRIGRILRRLNPALADADDLGIMKPVGGRALYTFDKIKHAVKRPLPDIGDITEAFTRQKYGRPMQYLLGADFQKRPHIAGTVWKIFGTLERPELWCVAGFTVEGNEDNFLDALEADGRFHPMNTLVIADATGVNQNYSHENGKTSWGPFFARGWCIVGPQEKKTDRGEGPQNPKVEFSLGQFNRMIFEDRVHVVPDTAIVATFNDGNKVLIEEGVAVAFKDCKSGRGKYGIVAKGDHAHLVDTGRYVAWWVDPPKENRPTTKVRLNSRHGARATFRR